MCNPNKNLESLVLAVRRHLLDLVPRPGAGLLVVAHLQQVPAQSGGDGGGDGGGAGLGGALRRQKRAVVL